MARGNAQSNSTPPRSSSLPVRLSATNDPSAAFFGLRLIHSAALHGKVRGEADGLARFNPQPFTTYDLESVLEPGMNKQQH
jgi:hypothetical protein